jgi:hypothetical protein
MEVHMKYTAIILGIMALIIFGAFSVLPAEEFKLQPKKVVLVDVNQETVEDFATRKLTELRELMIAAGEAGDTTLVKYYLNQYQTINLSK